MFNSLLETELGMEENKVLNMFRSRETEDATSNGKVIPIGTGVLDWSTRLCAIQFHFLLQLNPVECNKIQLNSIKSKLNQKAFEQVNEI